ncbi:hypothetical protein BC938DRAFT_474544 [Jimgerdemannia flammicorona]|uniref:Galactose oxidase n=1 Tax=Jimgerdemannia flammicorona TaxID=994334 RepID=A0A433Q262_9FUNG|nr:hypothetical protein BC938DRAFT_474544 [Jimgerdemannia flammicorona]
MNVRTFFLLPLLTALLCHVAADPGPDARTGSCNIVWKDRLYVLGGLPQLNSPYSNFSYTDFPIDTRYRLTWHDLPFNRAALSDPGSQTQTVSPCVLAPSGVIIAGAPNLIGFDLNTNTWVLINVTGFNPLSMLVSRQNVRFVQLDDSIVYFGGYQTTSLIASPYTDFYTLNTSTWIWSNDTVGNVSSIPPNYDHSNLVAANGIVYMFGGSYNTSTGMGIYFNDTYKFDMAKKVWSPCAYVMDVKADSMQVVNYKNQRAVLISGAYLAPGASYSTLLGMVHFFNYTDETFAVINPASPPVTQQNAYPPPLLTGNLAVQGDAIIMYGGIKGSWNAYTSLNQIFVFNMSEPPILIFQPPPDWTSTAAALLPSSPNITSITSITSITTSTLVPTATSTANSTSTTSIGIVGPVIGGLALIAAALLGFLLYRRRRRRHPLKHEGELTQRPNTLYKSMKPDDIKMEATKDGPVGKGVINRTLVEID